MTENHTNAQGHAAGDARQEKRRYSTVFFDLDGTLLPIDTKQFMNAYMASIGRYMAEHGLDAQAGGEALFAGVMAMGQNAGRITNCEAFWRVFCERMGKTREDWEPLFLEYYLTRFDEVAADINVRPNPAAAAAVRALKERGYRLAVTTMPMFPQVAVEHRLRWAGLDPQDFMFMTTYEDSTSVKPYEDYYREALQRADVSGDEVLMVGNHNREDGGAVKVGCDIYLVTDHLIESEDGLDVSAHKHGSMEEFAAFCESLPPARS